MRRTSPARSWPSTAVGASAGRVRAPARAAGPAALVAARAVPAAPTVIAADSAAVVTDGGSFHAHERMRRAIEPPPQLADRRARRRVHEVRRDIGERAR